MRKLVAVNGLSVAQAASSGASGGAFVITPSSNIEQAGGSPIYSKEINIVASGMTDIVGTCTQTAPVNVKIEPDPGRLCDVGGEKVILEGDVNLIPVTVNGQLPNTSPCSFTCTLEVDDPGQDKVEMN